ncbi:transcriptional regulator MtlR [Amylibacter marinus]|uniref:Transcriptional regulator MtlR n=1 Tax=Amylibacter marinus TaxID=1475483 RepID=A0ABQ5VS34_9RHOB|nr:transcriptional regulator MtlR [Amylibacter marinus]
MHLILETHGKAFVGDYIGDFAPGALFLAGSYVPHNWITDDLYPEHVETRDMVIQFDPARLKQMFGAFPEFQEIYELIETSKSGIEFFNFDVAYAKSLFEGVRDTTGPEQILTFLKLLNRLTAHKDRKTLSVLQLVHPEGNSKQARIGEVVDYIVQHFADDISAEKAAEIAGMSPSSFSRNFHKMTGNRFVEFVNRVRIGQACSMLYATNEQISSICFEVGFQNLANFNRQFLKMKNMTPSDYRDTARRELSSDTPENNKITA